jgi:hypothetical protein
MAEITFNLIEHCVINGCFIEQKIKRILLEFQEKNKKPPHYTALHVGLRAYDMLNRDLNIFLSDKAEKEVIKIFNIEIEITCSWGMDPNEVIFCIN